MHSDVFSLVEICILFRHFLFFVYINMHTETLISSISLQFVYVEVVLFFCAGEIYRFHSQNFLNIYVVYVTLTYMFVNTCS